MSNFSLREVKAKVFKKWVLKNIHKIKISLKERRKEWCKFLKDFEDDYWEDLEEETRDYFNEDIDME